MDVMYQLKRLSSAYKIFTVEQGAVAMIEKNHNILGGEPVERIIDLSRYFPGRPNAHFVFVKKKINGEKLFCKPCNGKGYHRIMGLETVSMKEVFIRNETCKVCKGAGEY